ncbi:hypothetical protein AVEN_81493-1 [Araneus ventricosus]|uniref:Uncharacterized protein n=1 Tax=Araneus ventricosus TaxID=182803 RepID=A0A4Y2E361_ARAVE|nr:hypothetical protein AVEN_81493-1 [Araneus ventricosus]
MPKARCTLADLVVGSNKCQSDTEAINDFRGMENSWAVPTQHTSCRAKESQMTCPIQLLRTFPSYRRGNWTSLSTWQPTGQYTLTTIRAVTIGIIRYYGMES